MAQKQLGLAAINLALLACLVLAGCATTPSQPINTADFYQEQGNHVFKKNETVTNGPYDVKTEEKKVNGKPATVQTFKPINIFNLIYEIFAFFGVAAVILGAIAWFTANWFLGRVAIAAGIICAAGTALTSFTQTHFQTIVNVVVCIVIAFVAFELYWHHRAKVQTWLKKAGVKIAAWWTKVTAKKVAAPVQTPPPPAA